jgi:hypothetical protein
MIGFPIHGDLALSADGRYFVWRQGIDEVADRVRAALQIFRTTWWYNQQTGIRYLDVILEKPSSAGLALLQAEVRRTISETPGILSVLSVSVTYEPSTREAVVTWQAQSQFGVLAGTQEVA